MSQGVLDTPMAVEDMVINEELDTKQLDPCNVFVKHLPSDLRDADLAALFGPFGRVISSKIMIDPTTKKSLGFGFVRFSASIEAQSAIQGMDGHRVGAKRLLCKLANSPKEKGSIPVSPGKASADEPIKNSARHASSPSLASPSSSGSASSSPRASPPNPPRSNSAPIHPHALTAAILQSKQPSTNLYIKSLLPDDNEATLKELFGEFGQIETCKVMMDRTTGLSRCIGFVRFRTVEQATLAIENMNGSQRGEATLNVRYADDETQRELRKRLRQQSAPPPTVPFPHPLGQISYSMISSPSHSSLHLGTPRRGATAASLVAPPWAVTPYGWPPSILSPVYDPHSPWIFVYPTETYPPTSTAAHRARQHPHFPVALVGPPSFATSSPNAATPLQPNAENSTTHESTSKQDASLPIEPEPEPDN